MLPTRGRREKVIKCVTSFYEMTDDAELLLITDDNDSSYVGLGYPAVVLPQMTLTGKLNAVAVEKAPHYKAVMFVGDDHVFSTEHWDTIMMKELAAMGGTGILYPDDKRRNDIPEIWLTSSDIIMALGHFAEPSCKHYYLDNVWASIGNGAGCLKLVPEVLVEHHHYSTHRDVRYDSVYQKTETFGPADAAAFEAWRSSRMAKEVAAVKELLQASENHHG